MSKNVFITFALLILGCLSVKAIPAYPVRRTFVQPDGTTLTLTLRGDEHFSYYTTDDGQPMVRNLDGSFRAISADEVSETWSQRLKTNNARRMKARRPLGEQKDPIVGKKKGLVILVAFSNQDFVVDNPQQTYQNFFSQPGYNVYGMTGSVRDYFLDQSYGKLDIEFDVIGPVKLNKTMAYYGAPTDNANDVRPAEMIYDACLAAAEQVNFADYDWDGDNKVNQVFVIYAGYGQNYGADPNTIWPHEWKLSNGGFHLLKNDVIVDTYACSCELRGTSGSTLDGIGAACHEFTHCLGIPDFYDTSNSGNNYGMGTWDVMCQGSYNNSSRTPAGYTSYERMYAGWITPTELKDMTRINDMKPLMDEPEAYILYNEANKNEYYLLENRQQKKWDSALRGHGLMVIHAFYDADAWSSNGVNTNANQQMMTIVPADGSRSYGNEDADPFPGKKGVTELTNYTNPAATLYNENKDGSKLLGKPIDNIKESADGLISFVACRPELAIPQPDEGKEVEGKASFTITWPAVPNATSYEVEVTEVGSASDNPEEALDREYDFKAFESKSAGFTDISTKMADYGYSNWSGSKLFTTPDRLRIGTSSTTGYVRTATWRVPQSSDMTIVVGGKLYKEGTPVKGKIRVAFGNAGDQATYDDASFELTEDGLMVFHFSIRKDLFWIEIRPDACMYLNYLAVYDGTWTAEQLNAVSAKAAPGPRKASEVKSYTTETNSITLTDLNTRNRFVYRVRALGEESSYSQWSAEKTFSFSAAAGIGAVIVEDSSAKKAIYDLNGRYVGSSLDGLSKGVYIVGGKKVVR